MPVPVLEAADRLWAVALEHADQSLGAYREAADQKVAEAKDSVRTALLAKDDAEKELRELQERYQGLEALRAELDRRVTSETERRQGAEARIAQVLADGEQLAGELRSRMRHLEELLAKEQTRFDGMEKRLSEQLAATKAALDQAELRHRSDASAWRAERNELLKEVHQAREQHVATKSELAAIQAELIGLRESHVALQADRERLIVDCASLEATASQTQKTEESLRGEIGALRTSLETLQQSRHELERQLEEARKALAEARAELLIQT